MKTGNIFIIGADSGVGLELVRQLLASEEPPKTIFASYRQAGNLTDLIELQSSACRTKVVSVRIDVTEPEEIDVARKIVESTIGDEALHILINNGEICEPLSIAEVTDDHLDKHFKINTVGPIMLTQALYPYLEKASQTGDDKAIILNISSIACSITNTGKQHDLDIASYKMSKAALNMGLKILAADVENKGILVVMMCPGWKENVMEETDSADLSLKECVADMLKTLENANDSYNGKYINRFGEILPF